MVEQKDIASQREAEFAQKYTVIALEGGPEVLQEYFHPALSLFDDEFIPVLHDAYPDPETEDVFRDNIYRDIGIRLLDSRTIFVGLVENTSENLVGFTYAYPSQNSADIVGDDKADIDREFEASSLSLTEFNRRQERTAEVGWTIIDPLHRGKGGWSKMMDRLESKLEATGQYDDMCRTVRTANNYANGIFRSRYSAHIIYEHPTRYNIGDQIYYRVNLPKKRK